MYILTGLIICVAMLTPFVLSEMHYDRDHHF